MSSPPTATITIPLREYTALQKEVESLRAALMDPPPDVQEAVIKKLGLVSGEALDQAHETLKKAKVALDMADDALLFGPAVNPIQEALDAIKECGL